MRFWLCCVAIYLMAVGAAQAETRPAAPGPARICEAETVRQEKADGIPAGLLTAIALAETGRWDETARASFAWPWTVTARGKGRYFDSMGEAIAEVERLRSEGVRNIDVGCMQINLYYHGEAFNSLVHAFDPAANVAYAAEFLKQLKSDSATWTEAAGRYHSATPEYGKRYTEKVLALWNRVKSADTTQLAALEALPELRGLVPEVNAPREWKNAVPGIDWERTARLNARLAFSRAAGRQGGNATAMPARTQVASFHNVAAGSGVSSTSTIGAAAPRGPAAIARNGRNFTESSSFAANRQRQLADWRSRTSAAGRPALLTPVVD